MGLLMDATYEQGFSQKKRRSVIPHDKSFRHYARFRRIPATVEIEDSD